MPHTAIAPPAITRTASTRSAALDAVRVLAVVAVVIGHARPGRITTTLTFSWHVPVFFVLSGYLLAEGRDAATELRRRARTILLPTLAWGVIVTAVWWLHASIAGPPLHHHFGHRLLWGGVDLVAPYSPFWFMPVLVASLVLTRLLDDVHRWLPLLVGLGGYLLCLGYPHAVATSFWSILLAPACMLYVLAGRELRTWRARISMPFLTGVTMLAISVAAIALGADPVNIKAASFGTTVVSALDAALISAGLILIAESLCARSSAEALSARVVSRLATTSLPVILAHMLVLMTLWPMPWSWLEIAGTIVALWGLALVISRSGRLSRLLL